MGNTPHPPTHPPNPPTIPPAQSGPAPGAEVAGTIRGGGGKRWQGPGWGVGPGGGVEPGQGLEVLAGGPGRGGRAADGRRSRVIRGWECDLTPGSLGLHA